MNVIKDRVMRNFDHLELARQMKQKELEKYLVDRHKKKVFKMQKEIKIEGNKMNIPLDSYKNLLVSS